MDKVYDIILIGRGLSNLLFINQYLKVNKNLSILIIEKNKKIERRFISSWQGPGIVNLEKEFSIVARKSFDYISIQDDQKFIKKMIRPYQYMTYKYEDIINTLLKNIEKRNIKIIYDEIKSINENKKNVLIVGKNKKYKSKYVLNGSQINKEIIKDHINLYQYFIGTEILLNNNQDDKCCKLMDFMNSKEELLFNYNIPTSNKKLLVESTVFGKKINFTRLKKKHNKILKKYSFKKIVSSEQGVISMSLNERFHRTKRVIQTGLNGGFARPSSGYSLHRSAQWAVVSKYKNLSEISYKNRILLQFLDSIFIKACFYFPVGAKKIFMQLFSSNDVSSVLRFMSDIPTKFDIIKVIINCPKKIMLHASIK